MAPAPCVEGTRICFRKFGFFFFKQKAAYENWRDWSSDVCSSDLYSFEPVPVGLTPPNDSYVLGGQANVWTEYIAATTHLEYMIFPRLDALAEVVWSPKDSRNWEDFQRRLKVDERRLDKLGVNHRHDNTVKLGEWTPSQLSTTNVTD